MGMMFEFSSKHTPDHIDIEIAWENAKALGVFPKRMPRGGYGYEYIGNNGKGSDQFKNIRTQKIMLVPIL